MSIGVYFIAAEEVGMVKIGKSCSLHNRLQSLRAGSPVKLEPLAFLELGNYDDVHKGNQLSLMVERLLHDRHDESRSHGEWFFISDAIRQDIDAINAGTFDYRKIPAPKLSEGGYRARWISERAAAIKEARSRKNRRLKKAVA